MLSKPDTDYLEGRWPGYRVERHGNQVLVALPDYQLPEGFSPQVVDLLVIVPFGFPDTQPDMFWVYPRVTLHGHAPLTSESTGNFFDRTWQRFSRHLGPGAWNPSQDNLQSWIAFIGTMLDREARTGKLAA